MNRKIKSLLFVSVWPLLVFAQKTSVPMDEAHWDLKDAKYRFETFKGHPALALENGEAVLKSGSLKNGTIDFDVAFESGRKFVGIHFRRQDDGNTEDFYLRPHQSGNPDATQYTPVFNGLAGWQLYFGDGYSVPVAYTFGEWMHVRLVINNNRMEVFLVNMEKPLLHAFDLKRMVAAGGISFWTNRGGAWFANFSFEPSDNPALKSAPVKIPALDPLTVPAWRVSQAFAEKEIDGKVSLDKRWKGQLQWGQMGVEYSGVANLARMAQIGENATTVVAAVTVISDKAQVKRLDFGFSDYVRVFCNDQILYEGNDAFTSRDYCFLGSIGYFDAVYLPLKKGRNEIWMAVTENFGGWGIQARFQDLEGLKLE